MRLRGSRPDRRARAESAASAHDDQGFTLVELLVVLVMLPLIMGAIVAVIITSLKDNTIVTGRLADSASAQTTSAFYVRDVQSAAYLTTQQSSTPGQCGAGTSIISGLKFELGLSWGSPTAGGAVVSYWFNPNSPPNPNAGDLLRLYCVGGSTNPSGLVTVAHGLAPGTGLQTVVTPVSVAQAAQSNWITTAGVSGVTISALQSTTSFQFSLQAVPRNSTPQSQQVSPGGSGQPPPLLLLGSGTAPNYSLNCSGNGTLNVHGAIQLDATGDHAANVSGNATVTASAIYTADPTVTGTFDGNHQSVSPYPPSYPTLVPTTDPYTGLSPPSGSGLPTNPAPTVIGSVTHFSQGKYTSQLSISSPGDYVFDSGEYILQNGISVSGQANVTTATGGVLFYVSGGTVNLSGQGSITLNPLASPPPPYPPNFNVVIWQAATDTNLVSLSGQSVTNTITGTVYAPGAQVGGSGNAGYSAGSIVAKSFACSGNGAVVNVG